MYRFSAPDILVFTSTMYNSAMVIARAIMVNISAVINATPSSFFRYRIKHHLPYVRQLRFPGDTTIV